MKYILVQNCSPNGLPLTHPIVYRSCEKESDEEALEELEFFVTLEPNYYDVYRIAKEFKVKKTENNLSGMIHGLAKVFGITEDTEKGKP